MIGSEPLAATHAMATSPGVTPTPLATADERVENGSALRRVLRLEHSSAKTFLTALLRPCGTCRSACRRQAATRPQRRDRGVGGGQQILLGGSLNEAVLDLNARDRRGAAQLRQSWRLALTRQAGKVRKARVENLAPARDEIVEPLARSPSTGDAVGHQRTRAEIDSIGLRAASGSLRPTRSSPCGWPVDENAGVGFRRSENLVASTKLSRLAGQQVAQNLLD